MLLQILKSKIHRARITSTDVNYEGSLGIDQDFLDAAGILPYEKILVVNATNGERLETYAISAARGSRTMLLNGAAARKGLTGDVIIIMSFAGMTPDEARDFKPTVIVLDEENRMVQKK